MRDDPTGRALGAYVLGAVMPLWIGAGFADYWLHRRSKIEAHAGTFESSLHAAGIALSAGPVLGGFFLELDAGVLLAMIAGYAAHAGMTIWDVAYASSRRDVIPAEQHVHGLLEVLPFTALSLVLVANRGQALALVGRGESRARFAFRRKRVPLGRRPVFATLAAFTALVAVPYAEELLRCVRYERAARKSREASAA
jgi:hypothetical protein